jgi:hypothetical protein
MHAQEELTVVFRFIREPNALVGQRDDAKRRREIAKTLQGKTKKVTNLLSGMAVWRNELQTYYAAVEAAFRSAFSPMGSETNS